MYIRILGIFTIVCTDIYINYTSAQSKTYIYDLKLGELLEIDNKALFNNIIDNNDFKILIITYERIRKIMEIERLVEILEIIAKRIEGTVEKTETSIKFFYNGVSFSDELSAITNIIYKMKNMNKCDLALCSETTYEIALDRRLDIMRLIDRNDLGIIEDCENHIKYEITNASAEYILWVLLTLTDVEIRTLKDIRIINRSAIKYRMEEIEDVSLLNFLRLFFRSILTLQIKSSNSKTKLHFEQLFDSFRFQMTNYYDDVIMPIEDFKDLCLRMIGRRIDNNICDFTAPKRIYIEELTNQYYMGISSKLPFVEFISYYHVMEYFFEKVYNDEMIKNLQDKISSPRFSVKRENDIKEIVKFVNKKVRDRNERYDINEQEALELVLRKYIKVQELVNTIDSEFINYYISTEVPFSKGDKIDFSDILNLKLYIKIAARIYKTRNSIIHSKSGDKAVFSPFKDDKSLEKEIPLLRYIAEEIIIKTSKLM